MEDTMPKWEMIVYQAATVMGQGYNTIKVQQLLTYFHPSEEETPVPEYESMSAVLADGWEPLGVSCYVGPGSFAPMTVWITSFRRPLKEEDDG
jgi:hypothetical protein